LPVRRSDLAPFHDSHQNALSRGDYETNTFGAHVVASSKSTQSWRPPAIALRQTLNADSGCAIVMLQDFSVMPAVIGHDCRAYLAQANAVAPAGSEQDKAIGHFVYYEC
jgi:hypothetical protein